MRKGDKALQSIQPQRKYLDLKSSKTQENRRWNERKKRVFVDIVLSKGSPTLDVTPLVKVGELPRL